MSPNTVLDVPGPYTLVGEPLGAQETTVRFVGERYPALEFHVKTLQSIVREGG